jgi:spermine/spermidine synthase
LISYRLRVDTGKSPEETATRVAESHGAGNGGAPGSPARANGGSRAGTPAENGQQATGTPNAEEAGQAAGTGHAGGAEHAAGTEQTTVDGHTANDMRTTDNANSAGESDTAGHTHAAQNMHSAQNRHPADDRRTAENGQAVLTGPVPGAVEQDQAGEQAGTPGHPDQPGEAGGAEPARPDAAAPRREQGKLVFASFLMLFVELALIRWVTSNNVYVTKATNFVLLASFLGIGIGFLNARSRRDYLRWTPVALLALVGFVLAFPVILVSLRGGGTPFRGLHNTAALPQPLSLSVIFLLVAAVMAGLGQGVARIFVTFRPLSAYRLDILGSLAGIAGFSLLSFLNTPPGAWGFIAGVGLVILMARKARWWQWTAVAGAVVLLVLESFAPHQIWSPYNKLAYSQVPGSNAPILNVSANNIPYQAARSLAEMHAQKPFYFFPYQHVTKASLNDVLIIGAGSGNDVSVALNEGAKHVDAVEIDPRLLGLGKTFHPEHPYDSPRVTRHVDDGRAFLQNSTKKYNLILFALPDSLAAVSGQSAVRLESFLLTEQSLAAAKAHLAPGGTFSMYNYYAPFLLNRYASTLVDAFHQTPCAQIGPPLGGRQLSVLTVHPGGPVANCQSYWHGTRVAPATDDHPFPYLQHNTIPSTYRWMLLAIVLASLLLIRVGGGSFGRMRSYVDLACMGAAFLLLETKNVVQFALLFGTTWLVNSLVFAGVLLAVYLAVETAHRVRLPKPTVLYVALIAALALTWVVPQESLVGLPYVPRFLAGSALAFAPVFLANLVFAQRFADVETSGTAFAANLLGAMVGGALEYVALITGYRFLLIVIAVLYGLAFLFGLRRRPGPAAA